MRAGPISGTHRKSSVQITVAKGDSIISNFNQKSQQQKILELQQKHKELRRVRRENKVSAGDCKDKETEAFETAITTLYEKNKLIRVFEFQQESYKLLRVFGLMMIVKALYTFTLENTDCIYQLLYSIVWLALLKFGKYYLMSYISKTIRSVQDEYQLELSDLYNGLGVNKREGSFKKYSSGETSFRQDRNSLIGINLDAMQYNKMQSSVINNRTMTFKQVPQQYLERDNSFKENRSSITSFNTSSRRLIMPMRKPTFLQKQTASYLDRFPTASILEMNGVLQFALILIIAYIRNGIDEQYLNKSLSNYLLLCSAGVLGVWFWCLRSFYHDKTKNSAHIAFIIIYTRLTTNINQLVFELCTNLFLSYLSLQKLKQYEEQELQEFRRVNELSHKYGRYERIFQNMRSGYAILSYQSVHFQNENFKSTLGVKQDSQIFPMLKQIKRRMRLLNQNVNQNESSSPEKNQNQTIKLASAMEDLVNFLRNKPTVELNEEIEYYSEKMDSRSGQKFIRFFNLTFQFILWDGQQKIQLTIKDITQDKKHLDQRILQQLRNMMFKSFTHEIKTPLNGVVQSIDLSNQLLKQNLAVDRKNQTIPIQERKNFKQLQTYLHSIESGVHILQNNLNDLIVNIDYQMIENGELKINCKTFKLKDCFDDIIRIIKPQIQNPQVKFSSFFDHSIALFMESDKERIIRIVLNLLLNAQKFTQKGYIKFTMKSVMQKRDGLTPNSGRVRNSNYVRFEVSDTGLGISDDKKPYIFTLFESDLMNLGNLNQSSSQKSAKVGLPICQLLCKKLGGIIKVNSEQGSGSKFWFILPVTPKRQENATYNIAELQANKNSQNIEDTESSGDREEEKPEFNTQKFSSEEEDESNYGLPENFAMTSQMLHQNLLMSFFQPQPNNQNFNDDETKFDDDQSEIGNNNSYFQGMNLLNPRKSSFIPTKKNHKLTMFEKDYRKKSQFAYQTFNAIDCDDQRGLEELKNDKSPTMKSKSNQRLSNQQLKQHIQRSNAKDNDGFNKSFDSLAFKEKELQNCNFNSNQIIQFDFIDQISPKKPSNLYGVRQMRMNSNFKILKRRSHSNEDSVSSFSEEQSSRQNIQTNLTKPFILQNQNLNKPKPQPQNLQQLEVFSDRVKANTEHLTFSNIALAQTKQQTLNQPKNEPLDLTFSNGCECAQVLIVDDIDMNRIMISEIFRRNFNLRSDQAINGVDCIKAVKEKQFNECCSYYKLIFMDYEMPIMNGIEASKKIKELKIKGKIDQNTVIIGYTAYTDEEFNCISSGMEFFLPKPATLAQITACLQEIKRKLNDKSRQQSPRSNRKSRKNTFAANNNIVYTPTLHHESNSQLNNTNFPHITILEAAQSSHQNEQEYHGSENNINIINHNTSAFGNNLLQIHSQSNRDSSRSNSNNSSNSRSLHFNSKNSPYIQVPLNTGYFMANHDE